MPLRVAVLLGVVALQRLTELAWSRRNLARLSRPRDSETRTAFARMVVLHVALIVAPGVEASLRPPAPDVVFWVGAAVFLAAQALRYWTLATLGSAWNAQAVVDAELVVVTRGPFRWMRHPNYLAVLLEFVAIPAAAGAWISLVVLNLLHTPVLLARIRAEEALLATLPGWTEHFGGLRRVVPGPRRAPRATPPASCGQDTTP